VPAPRRTFLGKTTSIIRRQRVYQADEALEIDDSEDYRIRRSRLFYDEIVLVTHHRRIDWINVVVSALMVMLAAFITLILALNQAFAPAAIIFALLGLPFVALGIAHLALQLDVVTVFGKRTHAQMQFLVRKRRAREVYERIGTLAREHQERLARELAADDERQAGGAAS
jgi:hypothetical protein